MGEEVTVAKLDVLFRESPGGPEKNRGNLSNSEAEA